MIAQHYLGVYGNTQKTLFALYDRDSQRIDLLTSQSVDHEFLPRGFQDFEEIVKNSLAVLLGRNGLQIDQLTSAAFGLAGDDVERQHLIIQRLISNMGVKHFVHANEAALTVKTESPTGYGVGAINDNGFSVLAIDSAGNTLQVGGLGELAGDLEGGVDMAFRVWKSVYSQLFICGEETSMTEDLFRYLGIHTKKEFLEEIATISVSGEIRNHTDKLLAILYDNANRKDHVAVSILHAVGKTYARAIASAVRDLPLLHGKTVDVVLSGKQFVHNKNDTAAQAIDEWLKDNAGFEYRISKATTSPVFGALNWAIESVGETLAPEERTKMRMLLRRFF
ncbi:MAG: hypothetical protein PUD63_12425 [Clostridia bacterium]|nr:hypothetical protein [Clostridia bacterium]MDD6041979.1 hypothetical protein [Clostridia bacterium]